MMLSQHKPVVKWLYIGYILIFAMVIIGGITRLTGSGLSMADWKPIMGAIPPLNETDWLAKFELYKATPEFKIVNKHFALSDFKSIFWWEFIHRDLGRLIGLIFIIPFLIFWKQGRFDKTTLKKMLIILVLGAFQGLLGWYMVYSGLQDKPHVSHFRLAAHFSTALIAMLYIYWVALTLTFPKKTPNKKLKKEIIILASLIALQIIYGAFTAGLKAGYGNFLFLEIFNIPVLHDVFNNGTTVLFIHRYLAFSIFSFAIYIYLTNYKNHLLLFHQKKGLITILALITVQISLGISTLIYSVPLSLGILHQTTAVLTITACIYLIRRS